MKSNNSSDYIIKQVTADYCPIIRQLASLVWEPTYGSILSSEQLEWMFEWMYSVESLEKQMKSGHVFFIVYEKEEPVAYMSIEKENENRYHLQKIYILPSQQGKGLGRLLVEKAEKYIREQQPSGSIDLALNVNRQNKARNFYEKLGFTVESTGDFDIGNGYYMNDYIMVKPL